MTSKKRLRMKNVAAFGNEAKKAIGYAQVGVIALEKR
jgi:hypothetical protein